jgi:TonB family protein
MKYALLLVLVAGLVMVATGQNGLNITKPASTPDADFQRYREELRRAPGSALAHFRLGESFLEDRNFPAAANELRSALNGDPHPNWIDAWAHIDLGEIFDATRQRDRAIREYQAAIGTGDDTGGAQGIATKGLDSGIDNPILHRVSSDFDFPDRIVDIPAEYSLEARVAGIEGTIYLTGTVTAHGSVRDLHVVRPLGLGLEEAAIAAASQWKFEPARINDVPTISSTTIRVNFLLKSRQSRWHLLRVAFPTPEGVSRPHFVNAPYPRGEGIGPAAADAARLLAVMGRQGVARLAFIVDEAGHPVRIRVQEASEPVWGEQAVSLVRRWQFSPAKKDDKPVSTPCTVDLVWGEKEFTRNSLRVAATELGALR